MISRLREVDWQVAYGPSDDPLRSFYIPALQRSVSYDRSAGFFSSSALAVAAAGVAHLINNSGKMRLLVGADLHRDDVEAIRRGHELASRVEERMLERVDDPLDALGRDRRAVLAWMVAEGMLEIRVVLRKGSDGAPLPRDEAIDYYHPKTGIFADAAGNRLAFSGSVNESETAWLHNYELFQVFRSWDGTAAHLAWTAQRFDDLWEAREADWIALDIPDAVRARLIHYRPTTPPRRDPLEAEETEKDEGPVPAPAAIHSAPLIAQFIRDAARMPNGDRVGAATSVVDAWPHQDRVADAIIRRFPERFLIADEVGLGKTIEAGLILRQLFLSGAVKRCLLLAPASVLRQWQEELYEKFALNVPRYDGRTFWDVFGVEQPASTTNPFDAHQISIASSQLMKRVDRRQELAASQPFDLVIVDEAHHARRKDIQQQIYRPNRLLELLTDLRGRTKSLLLLTATPMQVHPIELWDLLRLIGLGGRWAASPNTFLRFFEEVRRPPGEIDWDFVIRMIRDERDIAGGWDPAVVDVLRAKIGPVDWEDLQAAVDSERPGSALRKLPGAVREAAVVLARQHTPLRRLVFRNTRELLRRYRAKGILKEKVATRDVAPRWVSLRPVDEQVLYDRLEEYISDFYARYQTQRVGLGFVMTVYRRRLTSSFYAVQKSLERRLAFLRGQSGTALSSLLTDEDFEQEELELDISEDLGDLQRGLFADEAMYVEDFLRELGQLGSDSKLVRLHSELRQVLTLRETVVIYTQYTDTLDYLRDELRTVYGSKVACYSGRGGEIWQNGAWVSTTKEEIKRAFREGENVKLLLCTEAASEGLNLQTCGVLINYDMPWNPMRVEQRIGRIDRIGQQYDEVWVRNYFYEGTVEAVIYDRLSDRIDWFEHIVGELQPILSQIGRTIQQLALTPQAERSARLEDEIARLRREIDERRFESLDLEAYLDEEIGSAPQAPVGSSDIERLILDHPDLGTHFRPHDSIADTYRIAWDGAEQSVTFSSKVFDEHPQTVRLLTLGEPLLESLFAAIGAPLIGEDVGIARVSVDWALPRAAYYASVDGEAVRLNTVTDVERATADGQMRWGAKSLESVRDNGDRFAAEARSRLQRATGLLDKGARLAVEEQARQILLRAATIQLVLGQRPELFGDDLPVWQFNEEAIQSLRKQRYPFAALLTLVDVSGLVPSPTDPFYLSIVGEPPERLRTRFADTKRRAAELVLQLASDSPAYALPDADVAVTVFKTTASQDAQNT